MNESIIDNCVVWFPETRRASNKVIIDIIFVCFMKKIKGQFNSVPKSNQKMYVSISVWLQVDNDIG